MISRRLLLSCALFALAALPAVAKSNFSGNWKLNTSKSEFGQMPPPTSMTAKIAHEDPSLKTSYKFSSDQGDMDLDFNYTTDGKENTNEMMGSTFKTTAKWEGDVLVFTLSGNFGGVDVTGTDKWSLSPDGKTLTMDSTYKSSMGDDARKLVFEKQ